LEWIIWQALRNAESMLCLELRPRSPQGGTPDKFGVRTWLLAGDILGWRPVYGYDADRDLVWMPRVRRHFFRDRA
jgi:hypothetical protein